MSVSGCIRTQLAVDVQIPVAFGGQGGAAVYIGKAQIRIGAYRRFKGMNGKLLADSKEG